MGIGDNEDFFKQRDADDAEAANRPNETWGVMLYVGLGGLVGTILAVSMGAKDMTDILGTATAGALGGLALHGTIKP